MSDTITRASDQGAVAVRNAGNHQPLLHLVKQDLSKTLCGRYTLDRIEPDEHDVTGVRFCQVCLTTAAGFRYPSKTT